MVKTYTKPGDAFRQVFIVRVWRSRTIESWRGQIVHVDSGEAIAFGSDEELLAYIQTLLRDLSGGFARSGLK